MRTDAHSPKVIDPANYVYVGPLYWGADEELQQLVMSDWGYSDVPEHVEPALRAVYGDGEKLDPIHKRGKSQCGHCGAHFVYGMVYYCQSTDTYICVGHICDGETMQQGDRAALDLKRLKSRIKAWQKTAKTRASAALFIAEHPEFSDILPNNAPDFPHYIVQDLRANLWRYGSLSDKQLQLLRDVVTQVALRELEKDQEPTPEPIPAFPGRATIEGVLVARKWQDSIYGGCVKMLVRDDRNFKVWGTLPNAIDEAQKGDRVRFDAKVEVSKDDPCFGFFSRPTKATVVGGA